MSDDPREEAASTLALAEYLNARLKKHPLEKRLMTVGLLMVWQLQGVDEAHREATINFLTELAKMEKI